MTRNLLASVVVLIGVMPLAWTAVAAPYAPRRHLVEIKGQFSLSPLGDPDQSYCNCYGGARDDGSPSGVHSTEIAEGGSCECGEDESSCAGTMENCDCKSGYTNCSNDTAEGE